MLCVCVDTLVFQVLKELNIILSKNIYLCGIFLILVVHDLLIIEWGSKAHLERKQRKKNER